MQAIYRGFMQPIFPKNFATYVHVLTSPQVLCTGTLLGLQDMIDTMILHTMKNESVYMQHSLCELGHFSVHNYNASVNSATLL